MPEFAQPVRLTKLTPIASIISPSDSTDANLQPTSNPGNFTIGTGIHLGLIACRNYKHGIMKLATRKLILEFGRCTFEGEEQLCHPYT